MRATETTQAVILAGGQGTRLRPLTNTRPKPLLPILGRPCVEYVIRSLAAAGIKEVFLTAGYRSQDMIDALGDGARFGVDLKWNLEETPAGTAGAVKLLEDQLHGSVVVASGDVLADVDVRSLVSKHKASGAVATMALTTVEHPEEFGIVGLDDSGRIVRFKEKPTTEEVFSNLINAGIYVLEPEALAKIPPAQKYDFSKQLFPALLAEGRPLYGSSLTGLWKDIGRPADLLDANIRMADRKGRTRRIAGAKCSGRIMANTFSAGGCEIKGPVYIGDGARIGREALLSSCAIGKEVEVGIETIIDHSFVMDGSIVAEGCTIQGSLIGQGCIIGPGVSLVNSVLGDGVRLDGPASLEDQVLERTE
jgi:NDP-sugar pyrophosphorylase family protein